MSGWFGPPDPIDPNKVGEFMQNDGLQMMKDRSVSIMDPNSALNQSLKNDLFKSTQDNLYNTNRIAGRNFAGAGFNQPGIMAQQQERNTGMSNNAMMQAWQNLQKNNMQSSNQLLTGYTGQKTKIGEEQASAYGQNITNKNNYNSAMAGNVMQIAGTAAQVAMMCDARVKKDIKKVGKIKTKNGKKVGLYNFKYKWADKEVTGVMAQDVEKVMPKAVKKGKNGLKFVMMNKLF